MNDFAPLTWADVKMMAGGLFIALILFVGGTLLKEWLVELVRNRRAKKNGSNGHDLSKSNGNIDAKLNALITAEHDSREAIVEQLKENGRSLSAGFDRICGKLDDIKDDTGLTRKIVEVTDDDLVPRVHNKPAVEKLIRKIWAKVGGGNIDG